MTSTPRTQETPWSTLLGLPPVLILADVLFWAALAAAATVVVVGAAFFLRRRTKAHALGPSEEARLWGQLEKTTGPLSPDEPFTRGRVHEARTGIAASPPTDEDRVTTLFQTLYEDQGNPPSPAAAEGRSVHAPSPSAYPVVTDGSHARGSLSVPRTEPGVGETASWPSVSPHLPSLEPWLQPGPSDHPGVGDPTPGSVQPWPQVQDLPMEIRLDVGHRLEADLEWTQPAPVPPRRWVPDFVRREQMEARARDHERLSRQVELAKALMHASQPELRKKGVELAYRLELELHHHRARQVRRTYRK